MKNKKVLIIILIVLVVLAIGYGIFKARFNEDYLYNQDGTITDGRTELIEHLKSVEDPEERKKQIDFSVEHNIITQEEANKLY